MAKREDIRKILIIGSGPIIIGQACEFDYSGTQACKALRAEGYDVVLVNSNPATIMTDPGMADHTYIEPLTVERITAVIEKERPDALLPNLGGQTALNLASKLHEEGILKQYGVEVIGVDLEAIARGEDRIIFKETMDKIGVPVAKSEPVYTVEEAEKVAAQLGYPVVLRPAYTMCWWRNACWAGKSWNWKWCATPRARRSPSASLKTWTPWASTPGTAFAWLPC